MIQYVHRNKRVSEADLPADLTLLDYLRNSLGLSATKEGCASGDCGACTVALGALDESGQLVYQSVNSCICPATELHARELVTAADLHGAGSLHPVQSAFVEQHASQCGFCTPGFIVSAFTLLEGLPEGEIPTEEQASQAVAGNLCRCTGYGPIIKAVQTAAQDKSCCRSQTDKQQVAELLRQIEPGLSSTAFALPESLDALAELMLEEGSFEIIAGGTDLMLEVTQRLQSKPRLIGLSRIVELLKIERQGQRVSVGAGVSFSQLHAWAAVHLPPLAELLLHIGSDQIRNRGTLGGNLGTASPIGDLPPVLLALDAQIRLWSPNGVRELPLAEFFVGYRKTLIHKNEIIHSVSFELLQSEELIIEKVSKRREDDISALLFAACIGINAGTIESIKLGLGGVAAVPTAAPEISAALVGTAVDTWDMSALRQLVGLHLQPMSDLRASAEYRLHCTSALLLDAITRVGGKYEN